jgi:hypothetical protein
MSFNVHHSPPPWTLQKNQIYDAAGNLLFTAWIPGGNARIYMAIVERETNLALVRLIPAMVAALMAEGEVDHLLDEGEEIPLELTGRARDLRQSVILELKEALEDIARSEIRAI